MLDLHACTPQLNIGLQIKIDSYHEFSKFFGKYFDIYRGTNSKTLILVTPIEFEVREILLCN